MHFIRVILEYDIIKDYLGFSCPAASSSSNDNLACFGALSLFRLS